MARFEITIISYVEIDHADVLLIQDICHREKQCANNYNTGARPFKICLINWLKNKYSLDLRPAKDIVDAIYSGDMGVNSNADHPPRNDPESDTLRSET